MTRNNMSLAMGEINDSAEEIEHIIKAIKETAFQTNLLALNAALLALNAAAEAVWADDASLGSTVAAIKNLTQRATQAVQDTSQIIGSTVVRIQKGYEIAATLDAGLKEINAVAKDISTLITEIITATNKQAQAMAQANVIPLSVALRRFLGDGQPGRRSPTRSIKRQTDRLFH